MHDFGLAVFQNADGQVDVLPAFVEVFDEFLRLLIEFHNLALLPIGVLLYTLIVQERRLSDNLLPIGVLLYTLIVQEPAHGYNHKKAAPRKELLFAGC